jgi:hypothetical protein
MADFGNPMRADIETFRPNLFSNNRSRNRQYEDFDDGINRGRGRGRGRGMSRGYETKNQYSTEEEYKEDMDMPPIDLVYTWVSLTDDHIDKMMPFRKIRGVDNNRNRYEDHDELKYSIRSTFEYCTWLNKIYIVMDDDQYPKWLLEDSSILNRLNIPIVVVKHSEIFPRSEALPSFNSHAIEANLWRIKGLSEHFLYANDDMFFGNKTSPTDFFTSNGVPLIAINGEVPLPPRKRNLSMHSLAWINNRSVMNILFGTKEDIKLPYPAHQVAPLCKSWFAELWQKPNIEKLLTATTHSKFRSSRNLYVIGLVTMIAIHTRKANITRARSNSLIQCNDTTNLHQQFQELVRNRPKLFCINDGRVKDRDKFEEHMENFLSQFFASATVAEKK